MLCYSVALRSLNIGCDVPMIFQVSILVISFAQLFVFLLVSVVGS